ncbi:lactonase family protein [Saccharicrinis fermentans]|uniref:6-phosphogluconolactonase n=1 Tax=Saccharicrinis fermentans DSM 9555 = JCM 21142 TaxID=869213 RepID=W7YJY3_9BACT|nr:lactonase family protein [Saccharicrinis fermentans]GAF04846.1 hypothetical protein JCM21142_93566 [Saccharicrinis fermentans DSM 9555 = JCM 21142]
MYRFCFLLMVLAVLFSCDRQRVDNKVLVYIGTTNNDSLKGIEYCFLDTVSGEISQPQLADKILNPNFLEVDAQNGLLFAIGERSDKKSVLKSYGVDEKSGQITPLSSSVLNGQGPCYVALDKSLDKLMLAYYNSGEVASYVLSDGGVAFLRKIKHHGKGPVLSRQKAVHAHSIDIDPGSHFIYAADLGADKLMVYTQDSMGLTMVDSVMCKPGSGPRHFDFSPHGDLMALVNELDCTVSTFAKDSAGIYRKVLQEVSLLPDTFSGFAKAADIHFSPDGKFLYASNRGYDCIGVFKVHERKLEWVDFVTEGIKWPRNFAIDPSGNFLVVANRDVNNLSVYQRNKRTGRLTLLPGVAQVERPICVKFYH